MPSTPTPLWPGYDAAGEDQLLGLLNGRIDAALDDADASVDERATRDFAQAIASHEWLKRKNEAPDYHPTLHAEADRIRSADVGSWRPN